MIAYQMWPHGVLLLVAVLIACIWLLFQMRADFRRTALLSGREALSFREWYDRYYAQADNAPQKPLVEAILQAFGEAFCVEPTCLRPTDKLADELALKGKLCLDDVWEVVDASLSDKFSKPIEWQQDWKTVDDVIRGIASQVGETWE